MGQKPNKAIKVVPGLRPCTGRPCQSAAYGWRQPNKDDVLMNYFIFLALLSASAISHSAALECPHGGHRKITEIPSHQVRVEWCENDDGVRDGPFRYVRTDDDSIEAEFTYRAGKKHGTSYHYLENSVLEKTVIYENGIEKYSQYTLDGLKEIEESINLAAQKENKAWRAVITSEREIEYVVQLGFWASIFPPDSNDLVHQLLADPSLCNLFNLKGAHFKAIRARYLNKIGTEILEIDIKKKVCSEHKSG